MFDRIRETVMRTFERVVEAVSDGIDYVFDKADQLFEYVKSEQFREAAAVVFEAVRCVSEAVVTAANAIEVLTGFPVPAVLRIVECVHTLGRFLLDVFDGKVDIPAEDWAPVAGHMIAAGEHFARGNPNAGIRSTSRAVQSFRELHERYPDELAPYPISPELSKFSIREEFEMLNFKELEAIET